MKSLWIINNIPTPYRLHFFRALGDELAKRKAAFHVSFMAHSEKGRNWEFNRGFEIGFPCTLHSGFHPRISGVSFHLNLDILMRAALRKDDVTIVAGAWIIPTSFMLPIFRRAGLRLFWSESNLYSRRHAGLLTSFARNNILSRFDGFCIPNERAHDWLSESVSNLDRKCILKLPNLVNESLFRDEVMKRRENKNRLRAKLGFGQDDIILICPARLTEFKGIGSFLAAIRELRFGKQPMILFAGEGPDRQRFEHMASTLRSAKARFLGFCDQDKMLNLYALSDIFLLPSFEDPNPLSVIEASHARLPLLLSKHLGNFPEVLYEGVNGWSFDPYDPSSIQEAVKSSLQMSCTELDEMGAVSAQIAADKFNTRKTVNLMLNQLERILGKDPGAH